MREITPIHTEHFPGNITEWYVDSDEHQIVELKSLQNNRIKEYHHDLDQFIAEGRNGIVCRKLQEQDY